MHVKIAAMLLMSLLTMGVAQAESDKNSGESSDKAWTPPPGRLPDATVSSLTGNSNGHGNSDSAPGHLGAHPIPEPTTIVLIGIGLAGLIASRKKSSIK